MLTHRRPVPAGRTRTVYLVWVSIGLLLTAGCAPRPAEPPSRPAVPEQPGIAIPAGATVFDVDAARSVVTIRVYRAGPMAKLGHNHVITSGDEQGVVWQGLEPAGSGFELRIPVQALVVDDSAARAGAGPDFAGEVPESARKGTYQNLLRPEVLDAAQYPEIVVRSNGLGGTWQRPVAHAEAILKGQARTIDVPLELDRSGTTLTARGAFRIRQTDFGMTPFSVAGGAIQVGDEVDLSFEIVATAR
jgi:polyisoprenoid-binding protein YceI